MRRFKELLSTVAIWGAGLISASILFIIVGFVFSNGLPYINWNFITRHANDTSRFVSFETTLPASYTIENNEIILPELGMSISVLEGYGWEVVDVANEAPVTDALDNADNLFPIMEGFLVEDVNGERINEETPIDVVATLFANTQDFTLRVRQLGGGAWPMIVATTMLVVTTIVIAAPLGILAAIYMVEYAKQDRLVNTIRFAIEILSGLPSVVYGLFGMMLFAVGLGLGTSILAGALTMSILLLPIMIRSTEEALKTVPNSYREASLGLGANKIQTVSKVVLPSALPGIVVGIILSIGRIVGETAALIFTVGTFASIPMNMQTGNLSIFYTGATLTLRAFIEVQEFGNVGTASALGVLILSIVFALNMFSKLVVRILGRKARV